MSRVPQPADGKGSLRWIQRMVNEHPSVLYEAIGIGPIVWKSHLVGDAYAEYRDGQFLKLLNIRHLKQPMSTFWPKRGPQSDALGIAASGEPVLFEAQANVPEILSPPLWSNNPSSTRLIRKSLEEAAHAFQAKEGTD